MGRRWTMLLVALLMCCSLVNTDSARAQEPLEPFTLVDYMEFPEGWKISGKVERVPEIYQVRVEGDERILSAKVSGNPIRVFKYMVSWNPFTHPVLTWRWRVHRWPEDQEASIDFYVSLHRDIIGIPTLVKYLWSDSLPVGTVKKGGFFSGPKVVVRSGLANPGEWMTETINVFESYRQFHHADPDREAVGIGLLVSSGVEMEISEIVALPKETESFGPIEVQPQ